MLQNNSLTRTYTRTVKVKDYRESWPFLRDVPSDYKNACRFCLDHTDLMSEIFCEDEDVSLVVKIASILSISVTDGDEFPTLICENCLHCLNEAYSFKVRCLATNYKLQKYFSIKASNPGETSKDVPDVFLIDEDLPTDLNKNKCTIRWNDQVPLASTISTTATLDEEGNDMVPTAVNLKNPMDISGPTSDLQPKKNNEFSRQITKSTCEKQIEVRESVDLDDVPLRERIKIEFGRSDPTEKQESALTHTIGIHKSDVMCMMCKTRFSDSEYKKHRKECFSKFYKCSHKGCKKAFQTHSLLIRHLRIHTGEKPFICDLCCKAFTQKEILIRHNAQIHCKIKTFKCPECDKAYGLRSLLLTHLKSHSDSKDVHSCSQCNKTFSHSSGLSRHQNFHNGTHFCCKICKQKFTDSSSVLRHLKSHHIDNSGRLILLKKTS